MTEDTKKNTPIYSLYQKLKKEAENSGYHLNPDTEHTLDLIQGLVTNEKRYGYWACPCRLATGNKDRDQDIICPCDYRDPDLDEYGTCYCALYVTKDIIEGKKTPTSIPERRPPSPLQKTTRAPPPKQGPFPPLSHPIYRCRVCGYLCARNTPPETCPICKAQKERFEKFLS